MDLKISSTKIPDVKIVQARLFRDPRGFFMEAWHADCYREVGLPTNWCQDNVSFSERGVLRGLHFQNPGAQGKLISVFAGEIFDVAVDIRAGSPTFGDWVGVSLSSEKNEQFWVPEGFAHGFAVVSPTALVSYKCTSLYAPQTEFSILWNDPQIGIEWPKLNFSLSEKDKKGSLLKDIPPEKLFRYKG